MYGIYWSIEELNEFEHKENERFMAKKAWKTNVLLEMLWQTEPKINITVVVVFLFHFISFPCSTAYYSHMYDVSACESLARWNSKNQNIIYFCVLSLNHLNAREIWRLLNCKVWSPDFKYRYDEMANINKCLLVCASVCVYIRLKLLHTCALARTHAHTALKSEVFRNERKQSFSCGSAMLWYCFERQHLIEAIDNWRAFKLSQLHWLSVCVNEWVRACATTHTHTHTRIYT